MPIWREPAWWEPVAAAIGPTLYLHPYSRPGERCHVPLKLLAQGIDGAVVLLVRSQRGIVYLPVGGELLSNGGFIHGIPTVREQVRC